MRHQTRPIAQSRQFEGASSALSVALALLFPFLAGACGADPSEGAGAETRSAALVSARSFLLSFGDGIIPADADAIVARAGGTIAARYETAGAVLALSSSGSFVASLRAVPGIDAVGTGAAAVSALGGVGGRVGGKRAPSQTSTGGREHIRPVAATGDPLSFRQWNMDQIHAPQAHAVSSGKRSVLVGVLDTGIDVTHPDMQGQVNMAASVSCLGGVPSTVAADWSNDLFGHGTHVAGIIAAKKNGVGVVGVAPGVSLGAIKIVNDDGLILPEAFVCGMDWAATHGFDVLNASFNIDPFTYYCSDDPDQAAIARLIRRAVQAAAARKVTLVAAAGNVFTDLSHLSGATAGSTCQELPSQLPGVIGVGAVGPTKLLASYSNYGFGVTDVVAPGGEALIPDANGDPGQVLSSVPPDSLFYQWAAGWDGQVQDCSSGTCSTYAYLQGTSQAAPHVAGVAALIISRRGKMFPDALAVVLGLQAHSLACPAGSYDPDPTNYPTPATCVGPAFYNNFYGAGLVDALAAVR